MPFFPIMQELLCVSMRISAPSFSFPSPLISLTQICASGKRFVYLRGETTGRQLRLVVDNSFDGIIKEKEGRYFSSKRKGFGLGIHSVRSIVEDHGGLVLFEPGDQVFKASVFIPLK